VDMYLHSSIHPYGVVLNETEIRLHSGVRN
jgi:hypothetical protein